MYAGRELVGGFMHIAVRKGWNVQLIEHGVSAARFRELIDFWHPDGCVINCGAASNDFPSALAGCPVVYLDRPATTLSATDACIYHDSHATAELAARELLSLGLENFAFVAHPSNVAWNDERESGFMHALQLNGHTSAALHPKPGKNRPAGSPEEMERFLKLLPKPVGVFCATDYIAASVISSATRIGIAIPGEMAVIGVDNDDTICEYTSPTLSSIEPDWRLAGSLAAETMERMLKGKVRKGVRLTYSPKAIVRRLSSRYLKQEDPQVLTALDLIRREACNGLTAARVAEGFNCSRRMAEIRFRKTTGKSILEEIRSERLKKAEELLQLGELNLDAIANFCGYGSATAFCAFYRKVTGKTPRS